MATVRLQISATPAHVRTARLVATAVARRSGVDDAALDEIRLAVGEACSRAVGLHREHAPAELVSLIMEDEGRFTVTVVDAAPVGAETMDADPLDLVDGVQGADGSDGSDPADGGFHPIPEGAADLLPSGFGLAVIGGLVDDLVISPDKDGPGTRVQMSWPLRSAGRA